MVNRFRSRSLIAASLCAASAYGCELPNDVSKLPPGSQPVEQQEEPAHAASSVGPEGGTFGIEKVSTIEVPAEALPEAVEVKLSPLPASELPTALPLPSASDAIALTPHGQLFDKPIEVTLHYASSIDPSLLRVMRLEDENDPEWEVVADATFEAGVAKFQTSTFSYYTVVEVPEPSCFKPMVTAPCAGACTAEQYCSSAGACTPVAQNNLCGNSKVYALHTGETTVDDPSADLMAAAFASHCGVTAMSAAVSDATVVDACSAELLLGAGNTIIMAGGPSTNRSLLQLDRRLSPAYFDIFSKVDASGATSREYGITSRAGAALARWAQDATSDSHDYLTIQLFPDTLRGALVISAFGQNGSGTRAAAWYFVNVVLPALKSGTKSWNRYQIVEWTDNGDGVANAADTYKVLASEAIIPPPPPPPPYSPPPLETPWQSNATGTLGSNSSNSYAMGYKFTPNKAGKVTALGGYFNGNKLVKLFQGTKQLASVRVNNTNKWSYVDITPVALSAGTQYTVAVYLEGSGGNKRSSVPSLPRTFGSIRIDAATQVSTLFNSSAVPTANFSPNTTMLGQADLKFQPN